MTHELKTLPKYFEAVLIGSKKFEIRKKDRLFKEGDFLKLKEWRASDQEYTGREVLAVVEFILEDVPHLGLMPGFCIMSVKVLSTNPVVTQ